MTRFKVQQFLVFLSLFTRKLQKLFFNIDPTDLSHTQASYRKSSKPLLVASMAAVISPLTTIIFALRMKSWSLALIPYFIVFGLNWSLSIENQSAIYKYLVQLIAGGGSSYLITRSIKNNALMPRNNTI